MANPSEVTLNPTARLEQDLVASAARNEGEGGNGSGDGDVAFSTDVYILPEAVHKSCKKLSTKSRAGSEGKGRSTGVYEDIFNDYLYSTKSALARAPSSYSRGQQAPPADSRPRVLYPPPGMHLGARYYHDTSYRVTKERCSMLAVVAVVFVMATMLATMFATQAIMKRQVEEGEGGRAEIPRRNKKPNDLSYLERLFTAGRLLPILPDIDFPGNDIQGSNGVVNPARSALNCSSLCDYRWDN